MEDNVPPELEQARMIVGQCMMPVIGYVKAKQVDPDAVATCLMEFSIATMLGAGHTPEECLTAFESAVQGFGQVVPKKKSKIILTGSGND
jgi:hypothetical protein